MPWSLDTPIAAKAGPIQQTRQGWDSWHALIAESDILSPADRDLLQESANRSGVRSLLSAVFGHSPFLSTCLDRDPWILAAIIRHGFDQVIEQILVDMRGLLHSAQEHRPARLRQYKRQAALVVALADLGGAWDLGTVTKYLSQCAELSVQIALLDAVEQQITRGAMPPSATNHHGIFILGMGKLGARGLNYSSDIDLIIFYDPAHVPILGDADIRTVTTRIARHLVSCLDQRTADGYVFRTDLRLRPDPASTPLAVDTIFAADYYHSTALPWERAAMLKARMVAGDKTAATPFLKALKRWVWRGKMDFSTLADLGNVKQRINQHHGQHRGINSQVIDGFNVKLGLGGIREIEFFIQAQQLIYGAHHHHLRQPGTLKALHALAGAGHISARQAKALDDAYQFWRILEHRLQMVNDQQTHSLPDDPAAIDLMAAFMGMMPDDFRATIRHHQQMVGGAFTGLFGRLEHHPAQNDAAPDYHDIDVHGFEDQDRARRIIEGWMAGKIRATRHDRARHLLGQLLPDLLAAFHRHGRPDQSLLLFDRFIESLPAGIEMFSLLVARPDLTEMLGMILSLSPALGEMITRQPRVLEAVLSPDFLRPLPDRSSLSKNLDQRLRLAEQYEDALDLCRRWTQERLFQGAVHGLTGHATPDQGSVFFSELAETVLAALLPRVQAEFARRHGTINGGGMAILAMGNLASGDMTVSSDLDLVLIYKNPADSGSSDGQRPLGPNEYWLKLAERLVSAMTAPTAAGRLYDLDLRLRPLGNSGPLAISLDGFIRYQREQAWTWEHMALTRARPLIGPPDLCAAISHTIQHTLTQPRDPEKLRRDVVDMRDKIDRQFGHDMPWRMKYRRGGLVDTQFIAQYLQLRHAHSFPNVLSLNTETVLTRLAEIDALTPLQADILIEAHRLARHSRFFIRLVTDTNQPFDPDHAAPAILAQMARLISQDIDFLTFEHHVSNVLNQSFELFKQLTEPP